jgi:hypothetical protein
VLNLLQTATSMISSMSTSALNSSLPLGPLRFDPSYEGGTNGPSMNNTYLQIFFNRPPAGKHESPNTTTVPKISNTIFICTAFSIATAGKYKLYHKCYNSQLSPSCNQYQTSFLPPLAMLHFSRRTWTLRMVQRWWYVA